MEGNDDDMPRRVAAFTRDVQTWWEDEGVPNDERGRRWKTLLDEYDDLPLVLRQGNAAKVGKRVGRIREPR